MAEKKEKMILLLFQAQYRIAAGIVTEKRRGS
jgi:hypothetical protein